eukprot:6903814-Pyramimonas_sp.AAC.1
MKRRLLRAPPKGAKRVHSLLKYDQRADLEHLVTPIDVKQMPEDLMEHRQQCWRGHWEAPPERREALSGVLDELR